MDAFVARFKSFYAQPYDAKMNASGWFLFIGMLLLIMAGWAMILKAVHGPQ